MFFFSFFSAGLCVSQNTSPLLLSTTAVIAVSSQSPLPRLTIIPNPIQDTPSVVSAVHLFTLHSLTTNLKTKLYLVTTLLLFRPPLAASPHSSLRSSTHFLFISLHFPSFPSAVTSTLWRRLILLNKHPRW